MSLRKTLLQILLPIVIVAVGLGLTLAMIKGRKPPVRQARENPGVLVEVMTAHRDDVRVVVRGTGTVQPRRESRIIPQVSGRVAVVSPNLVAGGFFAAGDLLFEIEAVDFRLAAERARAALVRADYELVTVESQARVARLEWDRLSESGTAEANPLVLYEPQLANARAAVAAARASLEEAELDLARTRVAAPFDCLVRSKNVDVGQFISPGTPVAEVVGTETAEIIVPLPLEELRWLSIPGPGSAEAGSRAFISIEGGQTTWDGRIVRSLGEVDPMGRMARVAIAVDDPYGLKGGDPIPALRFGMFVSAAIEGNLLRNVIPLPRLALRDNETVWVTDAEDLLRIVPVAVVRKEADTVLVRDGLGEGDRVVLTLLTGVANGMKLRPRTQEEMPR